MQETLNYVWISSSTTRRRQFQRVAQAVEKVDHTSILHDSHDLKLVLNVHQVS